MSTDESVQNNAATPAYPPNRLRHFEVNTGPSVLAGQWVRQNTAILVVHGIGNQEPFDTLDQFARGLARTYRDNGRPDLILTHELAPKPTERSDLPWYDNFIRLSVPDSPHYIDIYEYYWANYTEDQASLNDIQAWLSAVADRAGKFYGDNADLSRLYGDQSVFFARRRDPITGTEKVVFRKGVYRAFLSVAGFTIPFLTKLGESVTAALQKVPVVGAALGRFVSSFSHSGLHALANVIGDLTVYNALCERSKHQQVRRRILEGAVQALRYLIEPTAPDHLWRYQRVIVAGHSLGSEVSFDAINRLNLHVNQGNLRGFDRQGRFCREGKPIRDHGLQNIAELLCGYVTFGSPLDKVAFFLRAQSDAGQFLRQQIVQHYHGFKQRDWTPPRPPPGFLPLGAALERRFHNIRWNNYFDANDFVSGPLDYYDKVVNVDCRFTCPVRPSTWRLLAVGWGAWTLGTATLTGWLTVVAWRALVDLPLRQIVAWIQDHSFLQWMGASWPLWAWLGGTVALLVVSACKVGRAFSHSRYWDSPEMHLEIIEQFLHPEKPPVHEETATSTRHSQPGLSTATPTAPRHELHSGSQAARLQP